MTYPGIENDAAAVAENPDRVAVEERRKAQQEEFGTYVAVQDIPWGAVTANYRGEPVGKEVVERLGWEGLGLVVRRDSKEGRELLESLGTATDDDRARWAELDKPADKPAVKPAAIKTGGSN